MICRKAVFLAGLTLCASHFSFCQTVISANHGSWTDPSTWTGGIVPSASNASLVIVQHDVHISSPIESPSIEVNGTLEVESNGSLKIIPPEAATASLNVAGVVNVFGIIIGVDGITYTTSPSTMHFDAGGSFHYEGGPKGYIPMASWHEASTLVIKGFRSQGYVALAFAQSWNQAFGNVVYDCPGQTTFVDFNGHLRNVRGDLTVRNTNNQALRLSTSQKPVIRIGGNFVVEGPSEVWLATTGDSAVLYVDNDFHYNSASNGPTYLTTRGRSWVNIGGDFIMNSPGALRFCSGSADSTGIRRATIVVAGNMQVAQGTLISPSPGRGKIVFNGASDQDVVTASGTFSGVFDYHVSETATVNLGTSVLQGSGRLYVKGTLGVGSLHVSGALQLPGAGGNILNTGRRHFYRNSTIVYNGAGDQSIGNGHPADSSVSLRCTGPYEITILKELTVKTLELLRRRIHTNGMAMRVFGDCKLDTRSEFVGRSSMHFLGGKNQAFDASGRAIDELVVQKTANTGLRLTAPVAVREKVEIPSPFVYIDASGNLTLLSSNDEFTAQVATLPEGSSIRGDVTVQRYMSGEGRIYRYLSSPVVSASVKQMQDDFPVTGTFNDPTKGRGLDSKAPSLWYFDESVKNLGSGWTNFPSAGYAAENYLTPGVGYAAFIRESTNATIFDVTGILNQGRVELPVTYTPAAPPSVRGWNLVGNPYPSTIDWSKTEGWEKSPGLSTSFAIRDNAIGGFRYFDGDIGNLPLGVIAPAQAFWIRASQPAPKLVINENAKTSSPSEFFRDQTQPIDYIQLVVSGKSYSDEAFVRKRAGSATGLDDMDAVKRDNDFFSLFTLTKDLTRVAINALDTFQLREEFPLHMKFSQSVQPSQRRGAYVLTINAHGLFKECKIYVVDHVTNLVSESNVVQFVIDENNESVADRFSLIVESSIGQPRPFCTLRPFDCDASTIVVEVNDASENLRYFAMVKGSKYAADSTVNGSTRIHIPKPSDLTTSILVVEETLRGNDTIQMLQVRLAENIPSVASATRCPDRARVHLSRPRYEGTFHWFRGRDSAPFLISQDTAVIIEENSRNNYRVKFFPRDGCAGPAVDVTMRDYDPFVFEIRREEDLLVSNYNALWYFDDTTYATDSLSFITPEVDGLYSARAWYKGCALETNYRFIGSKPKLSIRPIPFADHLHVSIAHGETILSLQLISVDGRTILELTPNRPRALLDTGKVTVGMYLLRITTEKAKYIRMVCK